MIRNTLHTRRDSRTDAVLRCGACVSRHRQIVGLTMTRADEIADLRRRYKSAMEERKWKTATLIWCRLQSLMTRQLNAENRKVKRACA